MIESLRGPGDPLQKIRRNLDVLLDYFNEHQTSFTVFFAAAPGDMVAPMGDVRARLDGRGCAPEDYTDLCRAELAVVHEAQARGMVRKDLDPEEIQRFMHGLTMGVLGSWSVARRAPPRDVQTRLLWSFMTGGIGANADSPVVRKPRNQSARPRR
jgi:hypothetical protein